MPLASRFLIAAEQCNIADITTVAAIDVVRLLRLVPTELSRPNLLRWRAVIAL